VVVELVNENNVTIGSDSLSLRGGWTWRQREGYWDNITTKITPRLDGPQKVEFTGVDAKNIVTTIYQGIYMIDIP
jgi:hypothetical protein